jgi:hypothetical protein
VRTRRCGPGTRWNGWECVGWRRCDPGFYWSSYYKECRPKVRSCPFGYRYRAGWGCAPICPSGWYFSGGRCHKVARRCPSNKFYSHALGRCVRKCGPGFYWSFRKQRCKRRHW